VTTPARASTYAYVNPVVAVFLGWLIAGEQLTTRMLLAGAIIVGAVAMIAFGQATPPNRPRPTIATDARRTSRTSRTAG
jgi:drug/metabolite transporter (DMT)-like permease